MTLLFIILFFIITVLFAVFNYKKTSISLLITGIILCTILGSGVLPYLLFKPLEMPSSESAELKFAKRNGIIILGGGIVEASHLKTYKPFIAAYSRINEGAQLYYACKKNADECVVIVSGGDTKSKGITEAQVYKNELLALGVYDNDIVLEEKSKNTYENALYTSQVLKKLEIKKIFLVTSAVHMKRALRSFEHFGILASPVPSDYPGVDLSVLPRTYNLVMTDFILHEYLGIIKYYLCYLHGASQKTINVH